MSQLDDIRARITDCKTYNFGMRNADKLAHEDAPRLLAALDAVSALVDRTTNAPLEYSAAYLAHDIQDAIEAALDDK